MSLRRILGKIRKKSRVQNNQTNTDKTKEEDKFVRTYKVFLENLIQIFYPVHLQWYEFLFMIILGVLAGLGLGYLIGYLVKHTVI